MYTRAAAVATVGSIGALHTPTPRSHRAQTTHSRIGSRSLRRSRWGEPATTPTTRRRSHRARRRDRPRRLRARHRPRTPQMLAPAGPLAQLAEVARAGPAAGLHAPSPIGTERELSLRLATLLPLAQRCSVSDGGGGRNASYVFADRERGSRSTCHIRLSRFRRSRPARSAAAPSSTAHRATAMRIR